MATKQQLDELQVGGGATGVSMVPGPVSKGKATLPNSKDQGDPAQSLSGDEQETNPENNTAPTGDMSAQNRATIATKEHLDAMFNGEDLSEDFRQKAATIFEAAIEARIADEVQAIEENYTRQLEEAISEVASELTAKLDDYLDYCVEQWMKENEVAIEHSLKSEITEDFMEGLKDLFAENYIEIPEDKLDVLEQLTAKVEELENKLNDSISENIQMMKSLDGYTQQEVFYSVAEGLALTQVEKLRQLAEGITFEDSESYQKKLLLVKENYFPTQASATAQYVAEEDEAIGNNDLSEENKVSFQDPSVKRYFSAISRTAK